MKPGRKVYVTINSYRQKMVTVPYVAGRSLRQAKNMLEVAGLGIEQIVYRPDLATNYVLEEYADGKRVSEKSRVQLEAGSGVTLYVGRAVPFRHSCRRPWGFTSNRPKAVCGSWGSTSARSPSTRESTC